MTPPGALAIEVVGLQKRYGTAAALRGVDLQVPSGSVLGLLGENGAGKTTMVRILATLLAPDGGSARVAGFDVRRNPTEVRRRIGLAGQYAAIDELLTGRQNLELVGRLHHLGRAGARARAAELLAQFELSDVADRRAQTYSGGMKRRIDLAATLVARPSVLFLDEPTTGVDPSSRLALWRAIRRLVDDGTTVLLTTQYMEEADELADRIVVLKQGATLAEGTPAELKAVVGSERLVLVLADARQWARGIATVSPLGAAPAELDARKLTITQQVAEPLTALRSAVDALQSAAIGVRSVSLRPPSLDEVFLELTGGNASPGVAKAPCDSSRGPDDCDSSGGPASRGRGIPVGPGTPVARAS